MQRLETCLLIAEADSFVSPCDVLIIFFYLMYKMKTNEIQLLSRLFCNSWLACLLRFLLTNAPLVKVIGNPISDGIVFKNELTHLPLLEPKRVGKSQAILEHLMTSRSSISTGKPEQQSLSLTCFFSGFLKSGVWFMRLYKFTQER